MPIMRLTDVQRQANIVEDIHNVFHFFVGQSPTSAAEVLELIDTWILQVQPSILLIQSAQIVHLEVRAEEVDGLYFASRTQGLVDGEVAGTALPPYVAYEFIYRRETRVTRNGYKRFAGPCEEDVDQGGNVNPSVVTNLDALGVDLAENIITSWATAIPVIYGPATPPPPEGSGLPERHNFVTSVDFLRVTTQNTRKSWR